MNPQIQAAPTEETVPQPLTVLQKEVDESERMPLWRSDYAALKNDLLQAQALAADFQRLFAAKCNETAQLKQIIAAMEENEARFVAELESAKALLLSALTDQQKRFEQYEAEIARHQTTVAVRPPTVTVQPTFRCLPSPEKPIAPGTGGLKKLPGPDSPDLDLVS